LGFPSDVLGTAESRCTGHCADADDTKHTHARMIPASIERQFILGTADPSRTFLFAEM
jgi:hypothetical protein